MKKSERRRFRFLPEAGFCIPIVLVDRPIFGMVPGAAILIAGAEGTWVHGRINSPLPVPFNTCTEYYCSGYDSGIYFNGMGNLM